MDEAITYRFMQTGEEAAICELVVCVFDIFVAPGYTPEGVEEFLKYANPAALAKRSQEGDHFVLVAVAQDKIAGMIEMRTCNHVSLLFVDTDFHRRGIAGELLRRALDLCLEENPGLAEVSVNSSPYAVHIYERLGFTQCAPEQLKHGIRFVPMRLTL